MSAGWDARGAARAGYRRSTVRGESRTIRRVLGGLRRVPSVRPIAITRSAARSRRYGQGSGQDQPPTGLGTDQERALEALAQEQGPPAPGVSRHGASADRRAWPRSAPPCSVACAVARDRTGTAGVSARRRGRDRAAQRPELLRRSDGGGRPGVADAARRQPPAWQVQPARHRHRARAGAARGERQRSRTKRPISAAFGRCRSRS